jgi:threonine dehydrogenase-like Zn-dependent dehydrogenase
MKAVTWQGKRDIRVETVPDPTIQEATDAIIRITSSGLCGSDLHLYELFGPFLEPGDILGHEPMGIVEEVGSAVTNLKKGDRVVVPFQIACGRCFMCERNLQTQCETTQVREHGMGAALFGYTKLYGQVPGAQAEYLRVPQAQYGPIKVPDGPPDERYVYLSDVLPTAWQGVAYADVPQGGTLAVLGLGPIGDMATRIARARGVERVIGVDLVPDRIERARKHNVEVVDINEVDDVADAIRELTGGRGADAVMEAVGMEAHGSPMSKLAHTIVGMLPDKMAEGMMKKGGVDRMNALYTAFDAVRRGGTVSISGVYGGATDPIPMLSIFDKQLQLRMGQANVRHWIDDILPFVEDDNDPLDLADFTTHHVPLDKAPHAYEMFQKKEDGAVKVLFKP